MTKVRFAPSPTGIPHVGNIRTALFDYFLAKATGGSFVLRLEDTDQARKVDGAEDAIKESLTWLGATWDEYIIQSERLSHYESFAKELVDRGLARDEEGAIRFIVSNDEKTISWDDAVGKKTISYESENIEDFIILKKDGFPTYHLANVVDDHLMGITHVIRGEDWIPSTPKHLLLYKAFGWDAPVFAHVPNVMGTDGKKLSKRRGAKSVLDFKKEGILPEALLNYLMLLGWSPKDDREILSKEEIGKSFSLNNVNVAPSIFDERKLLWMNGEYIRMKTPEELMDILKTYDTSLKEEIPDESFLMYVKSAQTRIKALSEFRNYVIPFVHPIKQHNDLLKRLGNALELHVTEWKSPIISSATISFLKQEDKKFPQIYEALIGQKQGLPLGDVFEILGKEKTLQLLK